MSQGTTYRFNFGPVIEQLPVVFNTFVLVVLGDVERAGASDMDEFGMQDVRNGFEVHLLAPTNRILYGFELLFGHRDKRDERVKWASGWIYASRTPGLYMCTLVHIRAPSLSAGGLHDDP